MLASGIASAAEKNTQANQIRAYVQGFYDTYLKLKNDPLVAALRTQKSSFTPELWASLQEDVAASQKAKGETVGLDFDPFLVGNDPGDIYKVNQITAKDGAYWVQVLGFYKGQTSPCCEAVVEVVPKGDRLMISNVHYPAFRDLHENENLISTLKALSRSRK